MNYEKYAKHIFETLSPGSLEMERLLTHLQLDVGLELHAAVAARFKEIVASLNTVGHNFHESVYSKPGEIEYSQEEDKDRSYLCCGAVISAGYRGTATCDAPMKDQLQWEREWQQSEGSA